MPTTLPPGRQTGPRWRLAALALVPVLLLPPASPAATGDLARLVEAAYQRHPNRALDAAERRLGEALGERADHPLAGDPAFNLRHLNDGVGSNNGFREWEGGVDLPLWWPGQRQRVRSEGEHAVAAASALARGTRLTVAGEVRERLWGAALARGARDQARSDRDGAAALARDIGHRVAAGELPRSDLLLARKDLLAREDALAEAEARVIAAEQQVARYTGLGTVPTPAPEPVPDDPQLTPDHPLRALVDAEVARERARLARVRGERRAGPSLWLGATSTRDAAGEDWDNAVGMEVSIPLGGTAHAAPAQAEADAALARAEARRAQVLRDLETALAEAHLEHRQASAAVTRAAALLSLAEDSLRLEQRAFELGEADLVRLLRARADARDARHALEARRLELGRAAARINQALGVTPQ